MYLEGLPESVRLRVSQRLAIVKPDVHPTEEGYALSDAHEAALFILRDGTPVLTPVLATVPMPSPPTQSTSTTPPDVLPPWFQAMTESITRAISQASAPRYQPLQATPGGVATQSAPRWTQPAQGQVAGAYNRECMFCSGTDHYVRDCQVVSHYLQEGKVVRNNLGRLTLPDGSYPPRSAPGRNMKERVDHHFATQGGSNASRNHNTVSTNFLETGDEYIISIDATQIPSDNDEDEYSVLEAKIQSLRDAQTLVANKKVRFDGVDVPTRTGPPNPSRRDASSSSSTSSTKTQYPSRSATSSSSSQPNIHSRGMKSSNQSRDKPPHDRTSSQSSPTQPPLSLPMKPIAVVPKPSTEDAKYRYQSAIEASVKSSDVVDKLLDTQVTVSTRELLSVSPDIRKHVKDLVASKKVAANSVVKETVESYLSSCFDDDDSSLSTFFEQAAVPPSAEVSLPLRVIYPNFAVGSGPEVRPECILDGGAQIVVMRRDIWEKLDCPLTSSKVMTMESANSGSTTTLGVLEDHPIRLGSMTVHLQVQIVKNAPFEVLLGRPFFDITSCSEISRVGGNHQIHLKDPSSNDTYIFPTHPRPPKPKVKKEVAVNFRV